MEGSGRTGCDDRDSDDRDGLDTGTEAADEGLDNDMPSHSLAHGERNPRGNNQYEGRRARFPAVLNLEDTNDHSSL